MTVADVAEKCGLSTKAVRGAIRRGELRAYKLATRIRIDPADYEAWAGVEHDCGRAAPRAAPARRLGGGPEPP